MNKKTAEKFKWMAQCLGEVFGKTGHWEGYTAGNEGLRWKLMSKDTVRFYRLHKEDEAYIEISNLSPKKISKSVYHDPIVLNKEVIDGYVSVAANNSDNVDMTRTYEIASGSEVSMSNDVGASVSIGLSQSISAGGDLYGFTSETTISAEISASFNHSWGTSESIEKTITTEIVIPPKTRTTLTVQKSNAKLKQDIDYACELEFSMFFHNKGTLAFTIESYSDLHKFRAGDAYPGLFTDWDGTKNESLDSVADNAFRSSTATLNNGGNFPPIETEYTHTVEIDKATSGDVVLNSEEIR